MRSLLSEEDMQRFMDAYLFGFLIGNSDMHVKNFSVKYSKDRFALTPIYDIVSFKSYGMRDDIALSVGGKNNVTSKAFFEFLTQQGMPAYRVADMCEAIMDNIEETAQKYIDLQNSEENRLYNYIREYTEKRCFEIIALARPNPDQGDNNQGEELGMDDLRG